MINIRALRGKIVWKETAPSILLVFNSFVWYPLTYAVFNTIIDGLKVAQNEKLSLFTVFYLAVAVSAILGPKLFPHTRNNLLKIWVFLGALATLLLITVSDNGLLTNAAVAFFLGASIGVGFPSCLGHFADATSFKNRGFAGGIIWSCVGFTVLIFAFLINMLSPVEAIIALTVWRFFGGAGSLFLIRKPEKEHPQKSPNYLELIRKKEILLYLFPWLMFSIINFAEVPVLERVFGVDFFVFVQLVEFALIGVFAIVGGVIADVVGRKRVVIAGFVMLGIEYAVLSAFSASPIVVYLYLALDGTTWGLFFSVFFMAIWGDLGENQKKEKYYILGGLPYLLAGFLTILIRPYVGAISPTAAFSFASFFLFLAVLPLIYAPETLPEKVIKDRDLKSYLDKALKEVHKESGKEPKKKNQKTENDDVEFESEPEENEEENEEAQKLAEKYY